MLSWILFMILMAMLLSSLYWAGNKSAIKREPIVTLHPSDYEWGDGKDLTGLITVDAIQSPDFASILADTTIAEIEREWEKAHPSEQRQAEKVWAYKLEQVVAELHKTEQLVDAKSQFIAKQNQVISDLKSQIENYRAMTQVPNLRIKPYDW